MKNIVKFLRRGQDFDMTQGELAAIVGVSTATISAIENGADTSGKIMLKISKVFDKDPREIFFAESVICLDYEISKRVSKDQMEVNNK